jgi:hypothetical protein
MRLRRLPRSGYLVGTHTEQGAVSELTSMGGEQCPR